MSWNIICGPIIRRTSETSATIWLEIDSDCIVQAFARQTLGPKKQLPSKTSAVITSGPRWTVKVGGRYYALLDLNGLVPGWLYKYSIAYSPQDGSRKFTTPPDISGMWDFDLTRFAVTGSAPSFRTFPVKGSEELRTAFGSCRRLGGGFFGKPGVYGEDVLERYGQHLKYTLQDQMTTWPHLLLLLGDQIYADNVSGVVAAARLKAAGRGGKQLQNLGAPESVLDWERDRSPGEIKEFPVFGRMTKVDIPDHTGHGGFTCLEYEDFAALYTAAWSEPKVARMLANLPTFMICDDHEIVDKWNLTGSWVEQMLAASGWPEAVVDGMIAYWMYQGWGNPLSPSGRDGRHTILEAAARAGTDALDDLRFWFDKRILPGSLQYYYRIECHPPIAVADTRCDRRFKSPKTRGPNGVTVHADYDEDIMGEDQWKWLSKQIDTDGPVILASGVPFMQFLCADAMLLSAVRSSLKLLRDIEELSQANADLIEYFRRNIDTDQWTAFPKSFLELTTRLLNKGPFIFLSGDVHYAYGMLGRCTFRKECGLGKNPMILHAVSSPLRSQWKDEELSKNDPEFCPALPVAGTGPCDPTALSAVDMRLGLPDPVPNVFTHGKTKKAWTHLNNIGILQVAQNGKTAKVTWLGASTKRGQALEELGSITSAPGKFVR